MAKTKSKKPAKKAAILTKSHNLNELAFAKAFAILLGLYMVTLGLLATYTGLGTPLVEAIGSAYIGYTKSLEGAIIGGIWGAVDGLILGYISAWLYNRFTF